MLALAVAACASPTASRTPTALADRTSTAPAAPAYTAAQCPSCADWNAPHDPVHVFGNTYWVGTAGLGSILVTSPEGHILIDGALPDSPPQIAAHIRALGFRVEDVKLILNSHAHFDHAGGIAALQHMSGAQVAATAPSARAISNGHATPDDPQATIALAYPAAHDVRVIADGETVHVGSLALTAHLTPGHTAGGTTWTWRSCEGATCHDIVYADSVTAVSADDYRYSDHRELVDGFAHSFDVIEHLPCDLLLTPHPAASDLWDRVASHALVDPDACKQYAAHGRDGLAKRLASESAK
jgi:metallo-beta-lactamase class B